MERGDRRRQARVKRGWESETDRCISWRGGTRTERVEVKRSREKTRWERERERERLADAWESLAPTGWCSTLHRWAEVGTDIFESSIKLVGKLRSLVANVVFFFAVDICPAMGRCVSSCIFVVCDGVVAWRRASPRFEDVRRPRVDFSFVPIERYKGGWVRVRDCWNEFNSIYLFFYIFVVLYILI